MRAVPYRENARWGELLSTHRASVVSWVAAIPIGIIGLYLCAHFAAQGGPGALKLWIGTAAMAAMIVWCIGSIVKLRRIVFELYERGFAFRDARVLHELEWADVKAVEAQYVPGALRRGANDEGNLVALVITGRTGTFTVPKELSEFRTIVAKLRDHTGEWSKVTIANLLHRS
jgi:hypothetical protein